VQSSAVGGVSRGLGSDGVVVRSARQLGAELTTESQRHREGSGRRTPLAGAGESQRPRAGAPALHDPSGRLKPASFLVPWRHGRKPCPSRKEADLVNDQRQVCCVVQVG
jgi:hypothetical protein